MSGSKLRYLHRRFKPFMRSKLILLHLICLFAVSGLNGQQSSFPDGWLGHWTGELEIFSGPQKVNSIPMSLEITRVDSSTTLKYFISYGNGPDALRSYYLKAIDPKNGRYLLDESNGIRIETYLLGDRLVSIFEVQHSLIQSVAYLENDLLHYQIFAGSFESISVTGDTILESDTIPAVQTFPMTVFQYAVLHRSP